MGSVNIADDAVEYKVWLIARGEGSFCKEKWAAARWWYFVTFE